MYPIAETPKRSFGFETAVAALEAPKSALICAIRGSADVICGSRNAHV